MPKKLYKLRKEVCNCKVLLLGRDAYSENMSRVRERIRKWLYVTIVGMVTYLVLWKSPALKTTLTYYYDTSKEVLGNSIEWALVQVYIPLFEYVRGNLEVTSKYEWFVMNSSPLYQYMADKEAYFPYANVREVLDIADEMEERVLEENENYKMDNELAEEEKQQEPENTEERVENGENGVIYNEEKQFVYDWGEYSDLEKVKEDFFAVDSTTDIDLNRIIPSSFLEKDLTIDKSGEEPQILIYHTHSQEGYLNSVGGDETTTVVGVGDYLETLLEERGFVVLHHKGEYDVESRDYAYSNALPGVESVLEKNPSIEVVIDLHRDAVAEDRHLVSTQCGKDAAQIMFFNGLSYTKKQGNIDYLKNPYIDDNLAFSFQMQVLCNEYYPGSTRKIYLKGYRYNMHLKPKSLLVEVGAQTNTLEEAYNSMEILAHALDMCLSPKEE